MKNIKIKTVYVPVNGSSTLFVVEEGRISDSVEDLSDAEIEIFYANI